MISIIVPVYNIEQYLEKCVDSILAQSGVEFEIILIDDGSTDSSPMLCDLYALKYPNKVRAIHTENKGLSAARNRGIQAAKGMYVGFVDGDDWIEPEMYECLLNNIRRTGCKLSICSLKPDYADDVTQMTKSPNFRLLGKDDLMGALLTDYSILGYACNKIFETELARQVLFDETLFSSEDIDFCVRYAERIDTAVTTPSELYHYRQRPDSMTGNYAYSFRKLSVIKAYENILPIYKKEYPDKAYIIEKYLLKQCMNVIGRMKISKIEDANLENDLNTKIVNLYCKVIEEKNNTLTEKINIIFTRLMPATLLRIKQWILKRRHNA